MTVTGPALSRWSDSSGSTSTAAVRGRGQRVTDMTAPAVPESIDWYRDQRTLLGGPSPTAHVRTVLHGTPCFGSETGTWAGISPVGTRRGAARRGRPGFRAAPATR